MFGKNFPSYRLCHAIRVWRVLGATGVGTPVLPAGRSSAAAPSEDLERSDADFRRRHA